VPATAPRSPARRGIRNCGTRTVTSFGVEVTAAEGRVTDVKVDAGNGRALARDTDDNEPREEDERDEDEGGEANEAGDADTRATG
jgi:hypothetical protein